MEDFKDLKFEIDDTDEIVNKKLLENLGITLLDLIIPISNYVKDKAEELTHQFPNIVPYDDYGKIIEDNDAMAIFLKEEASKPENWNIKWIGMTDEKTKLMQFAFNCKAVDDGTTFKGFSFINLSGKVKHCFAQYDT